MVQMIDAWHIEVRDALDTEINELKGTLNSKGFISVNSFCTELYKRLKVSGYVGKWNIERKYIVIDGRYELGFCVTGLGKNIKDSVVITVGEVVYVESQRTYQLRLHQGENGVHYFGVPTIQ